MTKKISIVAGIILLGLVVIKANKAHALIYQFSDFNPGGIVTKIRAIAILTYWHSGVNICQRTVSNILDRYDELISVSVSDSNSIRNAVAIALPPNPTPTMSLSLL